MIFKSFTFRLTYRFLLLILFMFASVYALMLNGFYVFTFVCLTVTIIIAFNLYTFLTLASKNLLRFLDAIKFNDLNQSFSLPKRGGHFEEIELKLRDIFERSERSRHEQEITFKYLTTLTQHIPIPLISIQSEQSVKVLNNAARQLFGNITVTKLTDLKHFGDEFYYSIKSIKTGSKKLIRFNYDGVERQLTTVVSKIITRNTSERLISLQDINSELNSVQQKAWQDLVRVLTHEIMNSINPINSLAKTAKNLVTEMQHDFKGTDKEDDLSDINQAIETISNRSDGLTNFVKSYRQLALVSKPKKKEFKLIKLFDRLKELFEDELDKKNIHLKISMHPEDQLIYGDQDLLEQVFINLIKNSEYALKNKESGLIELSARFNKHGKILIVVSDNGEGIPTNLFDEIFVPFFTTKEEGSGVGLALTQQIINAHDGNVSVKNLSEGGTQFTLSF